MKINNEEAFKKLSQGMNREYDGLMKNIYGWYRNFGENVFGEYLKGYLDHYSGTGVCSLVAEELREMFTEDNLDKWGGDGYVHMGDTNKCVDKLLSIGKSEDNTFNDILKEVSENRDVWSEFKIGVYKYAEKHYDEFRLLVADNLISNGYTDEYLEAYMRNSDRTDKDFMEVKQKYEKLLSEPFREEPEEEEER